MQFRTLNAIWQPVKLDSLIFEKRKTHTNPLQSNVTVSAGRKRAREEETFLVESLGLRRL